MSNDYGHKPKTLSAMELAALSDVELEELMGQCDMEPSDPEVCDACAAYSIMLDRQRGEGEGLRITTHDQFEAWRQSMWDIANAVVEARQTEVSASFEQYHWPLTVIQALARLANTPNPYADWTPDD